MDFGDAVLVTPGRVAKREDSVYVTGLGWQEKRDGLPSTTRLHDLRHGAATMLLEAGERVPTVAEYLGHASPAVTMAVYAHAVPGAKKRAANRLGAILRGAQTTPDSAPEAPSAAG